ncbi:hypothetical protein E2C01_086497 [Portunus trituberculatus]|uniref:Uncharacterized protein n=1 Tax=Portunus trituberculatus TaxID=210409 RepID=A0A5B7J9F8_PORTR|nr:hypothetical protein [Portunus trituberculatus]
MRLEEEDTRYIMAYLVRGGGRGIPGRLCSTSLGQWKLNLEREQRRIRGTAVVRSGSGEERKFGFRAPPLCWCSSTTLAPSSPTSHPPLPPSFSANEETKCNSN